MKTNQPSARRQSSGAAVSVASPDRHMTLSDQERAGCSVIVSVLPLASRAYCPGFRTKSFTSGAAWILLVVRMTAMNTIRDTLVFIRILAERKGERWRRAASARIAKETRPAAIRSTEKFDSAELISQVRPQGWQTGCPSRARQSSSCRQPPKQWPAEWPAGCGSLPSGRFHARTGCPR